MLKRYQEGRIAIIDLGTNAIRLNVYEGYVCIYQDKSFTALGRSLSYNGCLSKRGKNIVFSKMKHYKKILLTLEVEQSYILATEAVRSAKDAKDFIGKLENLSQMPIQILSGEEEARYLAHGVDIAFPGASGLVIDYGGGSMEIAQIEGGKVGDLRSFPYGVMRMQSTLRRMRNPWFYVSRMFRENSWIENLPRGRAIYISGGTWRMIAQMYMYEKKYPLIWVNDFRPDVDGFSQYMKKIENLNFDLIPLSRAKNQRRLLPTAAILLKEILDILQPSQIKLCAYGLREGYLGELLSKKKSSDSPLVSYARFEARGSDRATCRHLPKRLKLFDVKRDLLMSAYLLAAMNNDAPEEYKGDHAFLRVMGLPLVGISHEEFVWLAYVVGLCFGCVHFEGYKKALMDKFLGEDSKRVAEKVAKTLRAEF